ncbi:Small auxin-up RNA [Dillenia turbinata]|uniref:Small auxin-up RNA n=1 Tax=Dillenia turbinata TaxID=194707 RepID=A0AAN8WHD5_9MAGN
MLAKSNILELIIVIELTYFSTYFIPLVLSSSHQYRGPFDFEFRKDDESENTNQNVKEVAEVASASKRTWVPVANKGHFVVYTTNRKHFFIPLSNLNHDIFVELLRISEEVYGSAPFLPWKWRSFGSGTGFVGLRRKPMKEWGEAGFMPELRKFLNAKSFEIRDMAAELLSCIVLVLRNRNKFEQED